MTAQVDVWFIRLTAADDLSTLLAPTTLAGPWPRPRRPPHARRAAAISTINRRLDRGAPAARQQRGICHQRPSSTTT